MQGKQQEIRMLWAEQNLRRAWLRNTTDSKTDERRRAWKGEIKQIGRRLMELTI